MSPRLFVAIIVFLVVLADSANAAQFQTYYVRASKVNVRATPSLQAPVLEQLPQNTAVHVEGEANGFFYVDLPKLGGAWIVKALVSSRPVYTLVQQPIALSETGHNVPGVDAGFIISPTTLFDTPYGNAIRSLKVGDEEVLTSRQASSGWLTVVDISTGRQGVVLAERLKIYYTDHKTDALDFQGASTGTDDPPSVSITNSTTDTMYFHLSGYPEVSIGPGETQSLSVTPGSYTSNASSPGVLPVFGNKYFATGIAYSFTYIIVHSRTSGTKRIDPALVAQCNELEHYVEAMEPVLKAEKQQLDTRKTDLDALGDQCQSDENRIDTIKQSLDDTDQEAVDQYNQLVDSYNSELDNYKSGMAQWNTDVDAYNAKVDDLNDKEAELGKLTEKINSN